MRTINMALLLIQYDAKEINERNYRKRGFLVFALDAAGHLTEKGIIAQNVKEI